MQKYGGFITMKIIFNADDFGHSKGVNLGIIEAFQNGLVRSTTMMTGMPGFEHAAGLAKQNPGLKIGVHLTLSAGKSIGGAYKTITGGDGRFFLLKELEKRAAHRELDLSEVEAEYEAQIQKVLAAGIEPDHFDSHHHIHNLPGIVDVFLRLAKKYSARVRIYNKALLNGEYAGVKTTSDFTDTFYGETTAEEDIKELADRYNSDSLEIMCHPAYLDHALLETSSYNIERVFELNTLTSPAIKAFLLEQGHELCSFSDI